MLVFGCVRDWVQRWTDRDKKPQVMMNYSVTDLLRLLIVFKVGVKRPTEKILQGVYLSVFFKTVICKHPASVSRASSLSRHKYCFVFEELESTALNCPDPSHWDVPWMKWLHTHCTASGGSAECCAAHTTRRSVLLSGCLEVVVGFTRQD